jgi:signal peptidase II
LGILSFLISGYIIFIIKLTEEFWEIFGLSLILGGAIGNGLDRVINNYVIDFLDFYIKNYHWPAFNFADSFITVGGVIFFWRIFFKKPLKK